MIDWQDIMTNILFVRHTHQRFNDTHHVSYIVEINFPHVSSFTWSHAPLFFEHSEMQIMIFFDIFFCRRLLLCIKRNDVLMLQCKYSSFLCSLIFLLVKLALKIVNKNNNTNLN